MVRQTVRRQAKLSKGKGGDKGEPVEKKRRRKNGKNADKSTTEGKADEVDGRKKKRSAKDMDRKATVDYSKKETPTKSSKKPSTVTGSKKKDDAKLSQEQLENKKKLSRKSAAYHRARKAALLEGKSEAEAKQEGKQAWVHSFLFFLNVNTFKSFVFFPEMRCWVPFLPAQAYMNTS